MTVYRIRPADPDGCGVACAVVIVVWVILLALLVIALDRVL